MDRIEIDILNSGVVKEAERMMAFGARLTQRGHKLRNASDVRDLYNRSYSSGLIKNLCSMPHPTLQKFGAINVVVTGASRRFLAQITRHQNEVKFMSASLQYSNYASGADFVVPYEVLEQAQRDPYVFDDYFASCDASMAAYRDLVEKGVDHDAAGYAAPQGLRNVLIISATPFQWKHMIRQRTCRRNTKETRYVMLRIWEALYALSPDLFGDAGPDCMRRGCQEGKMHCGNEIDSQVTPTFILQDDFPLLMR